MSRRGELLLGLTLAEISLTLLFAVLLVATIALSRAKTNTRTIESLSRENSELQLDNSRLHNENEVLRASLRSETLRLRSRMKPSCRELKGIAPLFDVVIMSADEFRIDEREFDFKSLTRQFQKEQVSAEDLGCVHTIRVRFVSNISTDEYVRGLSRLESTYYVQKLGEIVQ